MDKFRVLKALEERKKSIVKKKKGKRKKKQTQSYVNKAVLRKNRERLGVIRVLCP